MMQYRTLRSVSDVHIFVLCHDGKFYDLDPHKSATRARGRACTAARSRSSSPSSQLLWDTNKQRAGQFACSVGERRVVGVVVLAKDGRGPGVGVILHQGFVSRAWSSRVTVILLNRRREF